MFDCQIGDAARRVELIRCHQRSGRTRVYTARARAAAFRDGAVRGQIERSDDFAPEAGASQGVHSGGRCSSRSSPGRRSPPTRARARGRCPQRRGRQRARRIGPATVCRSNPKHVSKDLVIVVAPRVLCDSSREGRPGPSRLPVAAGWRTGPLVSVGPFTGRCDADHRLGPRQQSGWIFAEMDVAGQVTHGSAIAGGEPIPIIGGSPHWAGPGYSDQVENRCRARWS